jgi:hypothetical protein
MIPEIIVNILYYTATFLLKKSEYLYEKKLFLECKNNDNYTEYTNNLIHTLNTFIIGIDHDNILFINHPANNFFKKKYNNFDEENELRNTENISFSYSGN